MNLAWHEFCGLFEDENQKQHHLFKKVIDQEKALKTILNDKLITGRL